MRFHKEGRVTRLVVVTFIFLVNYVSIQHIKHAYVVFPVIVLSVIFYAFIVYFFRVVDRPTISDDNLIIAPCDGKVVVIDEAVETEYLNEKCKQVSIFMSPLDVHMNWFPVSGKILFAERRKGSHVVAWAPKASTDNEHSVVAIKTSNNKKIVLKQIAGAVARRVVTYALTGKYADQNGHLGFIKFGSRVDLYLPLDVEVKVGLEEKVVGSQTVIAKFGSD